MSNLHIGDRVRQRHIDPFWQASGTVTWVASEPLSFLEAGKAGAYDVLVDWGMGNVAEWSGSLECVSRAPKEALRREKGCL